MLSLSIMERGWAFPYGSSITKLDDAQYSYFRPRFGVSSCLWRTIREGKGMFRPLNSAWSTAKGLLATLIMYIWQRNPLNEFSSYCLRTSKGWQFTGFPLVVVKSTTGWVCDATMKIESGWECHPLKFMCPRLLTCETYGYLEIVRNLARRIDVVLRILDRCRYSTISAICRQNLWQLDSASNPYGSNFQRHNCTEATVLEPCNCPWPPFKSRSWLQQDWVIMIC